MNKQEAILQIMELEAMLTKPQQIKLREAVKVLANFKMISVDESMPYDHPNLITRVGKDCFFPLCIVRHKDGLIRLDSMYKNINGCRIWHPIYERAHGRVTNWLPTRILTSPHIMDEFGNVLKFE